MLSQGVLDGEERLLHHALALAPILRILRQKCVHVLGQVLLLVEVVLRQLPVAEHVLGVVELDVGGHVDGGLRGQVVEGSAVLVGGGLGAGEGLAHFSNFKILHK